MTSPAAPQQNPAIKSVHRATGSQENATVTTTADTAIGDWLIAVQAADWDTAALHTAPTGTVPASSWTARGSADRGTNATHLKMWSRKVTTAGAQKVTIGYGGSDGDSDVALIVIVLDGTTVVDIDGTAQNIGAAATAHLAASVTPVGTADLLITAHATSDSGTSGKPTASYTPPTGMTSVLRLGSAPVAANSIASGEWLTLGVFCETRTAAGATGTRTATSSASRPFAALTLAVRGTVAPRPIEVTVAPVAVTVGVPPVSLVRSGRTLDAVPARVRVDGVALTASKARDARPVAVKVEIPPGVRLERTVATKPVAIRTSFPPTLLVNMTVQPAHIRVGVIAPDVEFSRSTVLGEQPRRTIYVRPRKRLRFIAQEVLSRRIVDWDVDLLAPEVEWKIDAATEITGKLRATDLYRIGFDEWAHFLHVERDGQIRASGMMQPWSPGGHEIDVNFSGITRYLHGLPYQGVFNLGNPVGVDIDPLDVVRHLWGHAQTYTDGKVGALIPTLATPVRIGEPERDVSFEATDASTGETTPVEFTAGPYLIKAWEDTDMGKEVDDLATETPFNYREAPRWNADRTDVLQHVEFGYPRLGATQVDLSFTDGQNLTKAFAPVEDDDRYASEVILLGAGEGAARVRGRWGRRVGKRARRAVIVERKDVQAVTRANAFARDETIRRGGRLSFAEVHLKVDHPNAPFGSFVAGDDIPSRATVQGYGQVDILHRVMGLKWSPHSGTMIGTLRRSDEFDYAGTTTGAAQ